MEEIATVYAVDALACLHQSFDSLAQGLNVLLNTIYTN